MKILFEADDAIFQFDEEHTTFQFGWKGIVELTSMQQVMRMATEIAKEHENVHWLVDRRTLEGYTPECRIWIKNDFVTKEGKEMIMKIDKIAVLESESVMAAISSNILAEAIKKVNPSIESETFDFALPASNWLAGIVPEPEAPKKKSGLRKLFSKK
ncbi:hypothetical protein N7E81_10390 [Reichenbachiella carrageenanivorans]|uniref:SpoIIAA-like n=1 Tax=Reichenbachiella carrageenanivorans TaxID=2979869 RepID=A0ABY6CYA3_9BACT|nr:hypothetical protein [Reichenbachiella carrageenanivorans]UXX77778.1 hypothetical protein N7E81_10390 [Reichenbachiella carrageenanivorans]